jgi:hypothetical protein
MRFATKVIRSAGSRRYNMRPSRSRTVTTESALPSTSTEIAGRYSPRKWNAPTIRSVLFVRSTAGGVTVCSATPPWYRVAPAQAPNGMAHSPINEVKKLIRIVIPQFRRRVGSSRTDGFVEGSSKTHEAHSFSRIEGRAG